MTFINQRRISQEVSAIIHELGDSGINILLQGPAGCGKTSLAKIICSNLGESYYSYIPHNGEVQLNKVNESRITFIDEIHLYKQWEFLYNYMDSNNKIFVFCTTEYDDIPEPFLSRCIRFTFDPYSVFDLTQIVLNYARKRKFPLDYNSCFTIANTSRGSPRIAKQRFDRIKLMLTHYRRPHAGIYVNEMLTMMGIKNGGYTSEDIRYLEYLSKVPASSLDNICLALQINRATVQREIEPFLLQNGNIQITSKGRIFKTCPFIMTALA